MKRVLVIYFILLYGLLSFNKGQCQDTIVKRNFSYGIKVNNSFIHTIYNTGPFDNNALIINYSLYLQYKNVGVFGGYSSIYNGANNVYSDYSMYNYSDVVFKKSYHIGLILNLYEHRHHSINLNVYDTHYSYSYTRQPLETFDYLSMIYNTKFTGFLDMLSFNPTYKYTFLKGVLSVECGISFVFVVNNNIGDNLPGFGANTALSFNPSAFFLKH